MNLSLQGLASFIIALALITTNAQALQFDSDVPAALQTQVLGDLNFLNSIQGAGATPLHREIFGGTSGRDYSRWFSARVSEAGKNLCFEDNAVACVLTAWKRKIWFSPKYTEFSHPQIARLMVILHEARHTEEGMGNWPHSKCPKPFLDESGKEIISIWSGAKLQGERACDDSKYGSYATATVFLKNISKYCKNCTEKVRLDAEIYGSDQLNRIINSIYKNEMIEDFKK